MKNSGKFLVGLIMLVLLTAFLYAQSTTVNIYGNVKDEEGKNLPGVLISATHIKSNAVSTTTTGKKGAFRLMALPPGSYQVSFDLDGYDSYVVSGIQLNAEQSITLRVKLKKKK